VIVRNSLANVLWGLIPPGILCDMNTKSLNICLVTLLVSAMAAWASKPVGPARIQGLVKDSASKPIAGAELHITAKDGSGLEKVVPMVITA